MWCNRAYTTTTCVMPTLGRNTSSQWQCSWSHNWWTSYLSSKSPFLSSQAQPIGLTCSPRRFLVLLGKGSMDILASGEPKQEGSTKTAWSCQRPFSTHLSILSLCLSSRAWIMDHIWRSITLWSKLCNWLCLRSCESVSQFVVSACPE